MPRPQWHRSTTAPLEIICKTEQTIKQTWSAGTALRDKQACTTRTLWCLTDKTFDETSKLKYGVFLRVPLQTHFIIMNCLPILNRLYFVKHSRIRWTHQVDRTADVTVHQRHQAVHQITEGKIRNISIQWLWTFQCRHLILRTLYCSCNIIHFTPEAEEHPQYWKYIYIYISKARRRHGFFSMDWCPSTHIVKHMSNLCFQG